MKKCDLYSLCFLLIISCQFKENSQPKTQHVDIALDSANSLIIDCKSVIIIVPDSIKQINLKKQYGEDGYNEVIADINHYQYQADKLFDSLQIPVHYCKKKHIAFLVNNRLLMNKNTDSLPKEIDLVFFNGKNQPVYSNSADDFFTIAQKYLGF